MAYKTKSRDAIYKFERDGFFGTGTWIKVYRNNVLIDELDFSDMNGAEVSLINEKGYFESMCDIWASQKEINIQVENTLRS